ncbi:MAG: STAS domain-containing protein [Lachnospiraceae bacterium]|nr:STAS domain-containing protein [Lachnospiraceae bacterium]
MNITKNKVVTPEGTVLNVSIDGRIDANNAEEFRDTISADLKRVSVLTLDFQNVDYISSVGIRSLLLLFKQLRRQDGRMEIININDQVREILKLIGLMEFIKHDN